MHPKILRHYCNDKRPEGSLQIWKDISSNKEEITFVQEIPENRHNDVIDYMTSNFLISETLFYGFGVQDNPQALREIQMLWKEILKCGWSVAIFMYNPDNKKKPTLIGANILYSSTEETRIGSRRVHRFFETKNIAGIIKLFEFVTRRSRMEIYSRENSESSQGSDKYLCSLGFCVDPEYYIKDLGSRILAAREKICQMYGFSSSGSVFTEENAITSAASEGYEFLLDGVRPSRLNLDKSVFSNENCNCNTIVFMGKKFERVEEVSYVRRC